MGLSPKMANVLGSRTKHELQRICNCWNAIIDCFLAYDETFLEREFSYLKGLVRKVFKVGSTDLDLVIRWWKQITTYLFMRGVEAETVEPYRVDRNNIFRGLVTLVDIPSDKDSFESLSALCSSRGLPSGGRTTLRRSVQIFKDTCSEEFKTPENIIEALSNNAYHIGLRCRKNVPKAVWHFSCNSSGSVDKSVSQGGKASELNESITPYLTSVSSVTKTVETVFGPCRFVEGVERWKTMFRSPIEIEELANVSFGNVECVAVLENLPPRIRGLDEAFSTQVYYLASIEAKNHIELELPIRVRVAPVAEPGGKVRIVSMAPWWLSTYMMPFGHFFQESLKNDIDGAPCLYRSSPSWDAYLRLSEIDISSGSFLFSDMRTCTDAFPKDLASALLTSFSKGLGVGSDELDLLIQLVGATRVAEFPEEDLILRRGILMGEPMTKSVLTLYMTCLRDLSLRQFLGIPRGVKTFYPRWFLFHIGGDDHFVHGPREYLRQITALVINSGLLISEDSHYITDVGGKYLQTPLYFQGIDNTSWEYILSEETYSLSAYCDHIKVRLLSPCVKPHSASSEHNVAIGKAKALSKNLSYALHTKAEYRRLIRDRFLYRMKGLLPSRVTEHSLFCAAMLPQSLGGLGLSIDKLETYRFINGVPLILKGLFRLIIDGQSNFRQIRVLNRFTNLSVELSSSVDTELLEDSFIERRLNQMSLDDFKFDGNPPFLRKKQILEYEGVFTVENFVKFVSRSHRILDDLRSVKRPKITSWSKRMYDLWSLLETLGVIPHDDYFSLEEISTLEKNVRSFWTEGLIDTISLEEVYIYVSPEGWEDYIFMSVFDGYTKGLPLMRFSFPLVRNSDDAP
jgi:hypothetical protein